MAVTDLIIEGTYKWLIHHAFASREALKILEHFVAKNGAQILLSEEADRIEASQLVEEFLDQKLSYTDAINVVLMKRLNIKKIFSFVRHFDSFKGIERLP